MRTRIHETNRQCGATGSAPSSSRGSPTGWEEQHGGRETGWGQPVERQALETRSSRGRKRGLGCQAESWSSAPADARAEARTRPNRSCRSPGGRLSDQPVDLPPRGTGHSPAVRRRVPSRPRRPRPACAGLYTQQKPQRRATQRDEAAIEHWRTHDWERIKKRAAESKLSLRFSMKPAFCSSR